VFVSKKHLFPTLTRHISLCKLEFHEHLLSWCVCLQQTCLTYINKTYKVIQEVTILAKPVKKRSTLLCRAYNMYSRHFLLPWVILVWVVLGQIRLCDVRLGQVRQDEVWLSIGECSNYLFDSKYFFKFSIKA
jgi:hypothetical protein